MLFNIEMVAAFRWAQSKFCHRLGQRDTHRYGNILGLSSLQEKIRVDLKKKGLDTSKLEVIVTAGANQAFASVALAICDVSDTAGEH
jgi:aspartate/methionine/tyrosine aminotransferase